MAACKLTAKELDFVSDLLTYEESAYKKARMYSRTLTDVSLAEAASRIADSHKRKFETLLKQLG